MYKFKSRLSQIQINLNERYFQVSLPKHNRRYSTAFDRETETQTLLSIAVDGFLKELGLKDSDRHLLDSHIVFRDAEPGITLLRENCIEVNIRLSTISI